MIVSEARVAANRANALKSSGPRTAEGKERSRANSFRHGMTGAGVVVPQEDAGEIERRFEGFQAQFGPVTESGRALVRRAAMLSVRVERCVVQEAAAISVKVRAAEADFDEAREEEVDGLIGMIGEEPGACVRKLRRMPEGIDRMLETWAELRSDLAHHSGRPWTMDHQAMAENLMGRRSGGFGTSRVEELSRASRGDFSMLGRGDGAGLTDPARRDWARRELIGMVNAEVAKLRAHRETIDLDRIDEERAGAGARALFDPSKAAALARKYEAAAERGMYRAIREMREVEAAAEAKGTAPSIAPTARLGSFSPAASIASAAVAVPSVPASSEARFGAGDGSREVPPATFRPY